MGEHDGRRNVARALAMTCLAAGCLPGDTRPKPTSLYVTAEPSQGLKVGVDTEDGWKITFERFLLGIGHVDFEEDDAACNPYAEARYTRLFDFTVAGREKVGTVYGLGTCRVEFRLRDPQLDALIGPGATASDVTFMRTSGTDRFADDAHASVVVVGAGTRGDVTKRFEWVFRRSYEITSCTTDSGGSATTFVLTEGGSRELRIEVRGEELFRSLAEEGADLRFQPIADADTDADGVVTLDELSKAPGPPAGTGGASGTSSGAAPGAAEDPSEESLEHLIYGELLPRVLRVAGGGRCEAEQRSRR